MPPDGAHDRIQSFTLESSESHAQVPGYMENGVVAWKVMVRV